MCVLTQQRLDLTTDLQRLKCHHALHLLVLTEKKLETLGLHKTLPRCLYCSLGIIVLPPSE